MIIGKWNTTGVKIFCVVATLTVVILIMRKERYNKDSFVLSNALEIINPPQISEQTMKEHLAKVKNYYDKRKGMNLTALGRILFLNESRPPPRNKQFKILMYEEGESMEERQLYFYTATRHEAFELCAVKNCILSYNNTDFATADAILFHLHTLSKDYTIPINTTDRRPEQRWVFTSDESPHYTFNAQANNWFNYSGIFNWSMIYRYEADAPTAFGRVLPLDAPVIVPQHLSYKEKVKLLVPHADIKQSNVLVTILSSNCGTNRRIDYIKKLQKYIDVDVYGKCAPEHLKNKCTWLGYGATCDVLQRYVFYLSFVNSNCNGFITEKVFTHALKQGGIPIFMGMYKNQSDLYMPPNSYIHIDDFASAEELAKFILHINNTMEENYLKYHEWRKHFKVVSEDGYMGAPCFHYCRLCEALNYNDEKPKVLYKEDLAPFLNPDINCHDPYW